MVAMNRIEGDILAESHDSSCLDGLTDEQQQRLTDQLDRYLVGLENGQPLDVAEITNQHPDIAAAFQQYLEKLEAIYGVTLGLSDLPTGEQSFDSAMPRTLGDFEIRRAIGRGGMGIVYEAWQQSLGRRVAIKLLPFASMLDPTQTARFQNESHAAGLLQHPNIVPVYSVGSDRGVNYYAMQFIEGESLEQWITWHRDEQSHPGRSVPRSCGASAQGNWQVVVGWAIDIADALQAVHEAGVIHRDVKPSNLMLDRAGKIWITDFGLARCQSSVSLTHSGDMVGTMRYMSPEQAGGKSALVDGRCDVYSLAATLYELLCLRPAFDGDSVPAILTQIENEEVISPSRLARTFQGI